MNFLTKIAAVEMNISTVITKETTDADLQAAKKHFFNIEHHLKNNTSHNSLRYAMKYDLIKIDLNKLTDRQKIGLTNYLLAELSIEQGKTAEATDYYTSYLAFADNIIADDAGRNLFYNTHLNLAINDFKNEDYENSIFHLRKIEETSPSLSLDWHEALYYKLLLIKNLDLLGYSAETATQINNLIPIEILETPVYLTKQQQTQLNYIKTHLYVILEGLGTATEYKHGKVVEFCRNILKTPDLQPINQENISMEFIKYLVELDLAGAKKPHEDSLINILGQKELENHRQIFYLTRIFSKISYNDNKINKKITLYLSEISPTPNSLDEAMCKASGYIVNRLYSKAVQVVLPFVKTQEDAIALFSGYTPIYEREYKLKDKQGELQDQEGLFFDQHWYGMAKEMLKIKDFKFIEVLYFFLGLTYSNSTCLPVITKDLAREYARKSIYYSKLALKSNKLPKVIINTFTLDDFKANIVFNKHYAEGFARLKGKYEVKIDHK